MPEDKIMPKAGTVLFVFTIIIFLSMLVVILFGLPKWSLALLAIAGFCIYIKEMSIKNRKEIK